jgi:hypothetical protein
MRIKERDISYDASTRCIRARNLDRHRRRLVHLHRVDRIPSLHCERQRPSTAAIGNRQRREPLKRTGDSLAKNAARRSGGLFESDYPLFDSFF